MLLVFLALCPPARRHLVSSFFQFANFRAPTGTLLVFLRIWTGTGTVPDGVSTFLGPAHESFKAIIAGSKATATGFERLKNNPEDGNDKRYWPRHKDKKKDPKESKAGISVHGVVLYAQICT